MSQYIYDSFSEQVSELKQSEEARLSKLKEYYLDLGSKQHDFVDARIKSRLLESNQYTVSKKQRDRIALRAKMERACISSITHRRIKNNEIKPYDVRVFQGFTEIKRRFDSCEKTSPEPPNRSGTSIHRFSKKSRLRMIKKCNKINHHDYSLPFFVHLTYDVNANVCSTCKNDLDNFLKRLRRLCKDHFGTELRYIWKMEFQERGAVHYHIAVELGNDSNIDCFPCPSFRGSKMRSNNFITRFRHWVAVNWNDVTDGNYQNLDHGTGVDPIENWVEFSAYASKYMQKTQSNKYPKMAIPKRKVYLDDEWVMTDIDIVETVQPTGRFWGMSQNWNMDAIFQCTIDKDERDTVRQAFTEVATSVFKDRKRYILGNYGPNVAKKKLEQAERSYKNQCEAISLSYTYSLYSKPDGVLPILKELDYYEYNHRFN